MSERRVHIDRLHLAMTGDRGRARGIAARTARSLLRRLDAAGHTGRVERLSVRVTRDEASDPEVLARRIADALGSRLQ